MRREVSSSHASHIPVGSPPSDLLTDGVVTLRLAEAIDIARLARYGGNEGLLEGTWVGQPATGADVDEWAFESVEQWRAGWTEQGGIEGGVFIVDEQEPFVGIVFLVPRSRDILELAYGVLPSARGRGIATRATRIAANWVLTDGGFAQVLLRIGENHAVSRRVAEKAGFRFEERFETYVTGTGETYIDVLYTKSR
jgi:[ribosomal protein S5]-alanine N-acetyltransferase